MYDANDPELQTVGSALTNLVIRYSIPVRGHRFPVCGKRLDVLDLATKKLKSEDN
jgi:hypothetical protein